MQQNLHTINSSLDIATRNDLFDEKVKKMNEIKEEYYISGLESQTVFQDEFATNFLDNYIQNTPKPEEKLNHLATAMCIEAYALNTFKEFLNWNLKWLNAFIPLCNSKFTFQFNSHSLMYRPDCLETTEGIAFYFRYHALLMKNKWPSDEEMVELKTLSENAENEEVRICAEWLINLQEKTTTFSELHKSSKVAGPLIAYINKTLKKYPDFCSSCFGISQFRTNMINRVNEYYLDDLSYSQQGIINKSDTLVKKISLMVQEFNHRETTLKQQGDLYIQIIDKIVSIRNKAKNRLEFMKKYECLEFEASTILPFSRKDYQKYIQETFKSQFPKIEPIAKSNISTKSIKPANKNLQKKKVNQPKQKKQPVIFRQHGNDQQAKSETIKSTNPVSQTKVVVPTIEMTPKALFIFQYAIRVKEWFKDEPSHLKSETYRNLGQAEKFKQKVYHGFSLRVDEHVNDYGFEAEWDNLKTKNKDSLFCIPGEIHFKHEIERGLFTFCQDMNGIVYHRHFTKKATKELLKYADPAFRKVDFPTLEESMLIENSGQFDLISIPDDGEDLVEYQKITGLLRIRDRRHDVQLVLFKS